MARLRRPLETARRLLDKADVVRSTGVRYAVIRAAHHRSDAGGLRGAVYRRMWTEAAAELGADVTQGNSGMLEIRRNGEVARIVENRVGLDHHDPSTDGTRVSALARLAQAGLSLPDAVDFSADDPAPAHAFLAERSGPVVVKPVNTGGGKGITAEVRTPEQLRMAIAHAAKYCSRLLVEEQTPGDPYRFLVLEGEIIDVIRRRPPTLRGDGRSTVRGLIMAENRRRQAVGQYSILKADLDTIFTLERQGLTLRSVPARGCAFQVRTVNNSTSREHCETVREPIAPELRDEVIQAALVLGIHLAGVDVVTSDLTRSLAQSGGRILEVNRDPSPQHHYEVADPAHATPVAVVILDHLLTPSGDSLPERRSARRNREQRTGHWDQPGSASQPEARSE